MEIREGDVGVARDGTTGLVTVSEVVVSVEVEETGAEG